MGIFIGGNFLGDNFHGANILIFLNCDLLELEIRDSLRNIFVTVSFNFFITVFQYCIS